MLLCFYSGGHLQLTCSFQLSSLTRAPSLETKGFRTWLEGEDVIPICDQDKGTEKDPAPTVAILTPKATSQVPGAGGA